MYTINRGMGYLATSSGLALLSIYSYSANAQVISSAAPAEASTASEAPPQGDDIVVTARKRNETAIDVPIAIVAFGQADLARYDTSDFVGLATQVPGMIVQPIPSGGGGSVALRGISSSPTNPSIDQAVAFNIDGVQVGSANIINLSQIDLQQIEVLKGPQALFFGKNSPAGVVSLRTADPTSSLEGRVRVSRELRARETTGEVMISGPVTDTLGVRGVAYYTQQAGWIRNLAQAIPGFAPGPVSKRGPEQNEVFLRGTVLFKPTDAFSARLKYNYGNLQSDSSPFDTQQRIVCPYGAPQLLRYPGTLECIADQRGATAKLNRPLVANYGQLFPFEGQRVRQNLASLELNYQLAPGINLTSVSGLYKIKSAFYGNAGYQSGAPLASGTAIRRRELSQELRASTSREDWPVNFTVGGYYQKTRFSQDIPTIIDAFAVNPAVAAPGTPASVTFNQFSVPGSSYSFFGQGIWNVFDELELAAGVRRSYEKKSVTGSQNLGLTVGPGVPPPSAIIPPIDSIKFTNTSPEVTLTYKPTSRLTVFGGWRNGFKSGGFSTSGSVARSGVKIDYRPEKIRGFEGGVKAIIGDLRVGATAYTYKYKDMQLSTFDPATLAQRVVNAASSKIEGLEFDAKWRPRSISGMELRGALNYNRARYTDFLVGCYSGQTIAEGCNVNPNPATGRFQQQDFSGHQLTLAPEWTGNAGLTFAQPVGSDLQVSVTGDANFSSSFDAQLEAADFNRQKSFVTFDASMRVGDEDDGWELALLGRNLTKVYRSRFVSQTPLTGISSRTGTNLEGGLADSSGQVNRGREVRLQLTVNFK